MSEDALQPKSADVDEGIRPDVDDRIEGESVEAVGERTFLHAITETARRPKAKRLVSLFSGVLFMFGVAGYEKKELLEAGSAFVMHNPAVVRFVDRQYEASSIKLNAPSASTVSLRPLNVTPSMQAEVSKGVRQSPDVYLPDAQLEIDGASLTLETGDSLEDGKLIDRGPQIAIENPYLRNLVTPRHRWVEPPADPAQFHQMIESIVNTPPSPRISIRELAGLDKPKQHDPGPSLISRGDTVELLNALETSLLKQFTFDEGTASWEKTERNGRTHFTWGISNPVTAALAGGIRPVDQVLAGGKGDCRNFGEVLAYMINECRSVDPGRFQNVYAFPISSGFRWHVRTGLVVIKASNRAKFFVIEPQDGRVEHAPFELMSTLYYRGAITQDQYYQSLTKYFSTSTRTEIEEYIDAQNIVELALDDRTPASLGTVRAILTRVLEKSWIWLHDKATSANPHERNKLPKLQRGMLAERWPVWDYCHQYTELTGDDLIEPFKSATAKTFADTPHYPRAHHVRHAEQMGK